MVCFISLKNLPAPRLRVGEVTGGSALAVAATLIEVLVEDLDAALLVIAPDLGPSSADLARRAMDLADERSAIVTDLAAARATPER